MDGRTHSAGLPDGINRQAEPNGKAPKRKGRLFASLALLGSFSMFIDHAATGLNGATAAPLVAVLPVLPSSTQFDVTGFAETVTLDPTCVADAHCGGTVVVDGHTIVIPKETIAILPASALTWQELFALAPAPYGIAQNPPSTGLALKDSPAPMSDYEFHVTGNRVVLGGQDRYIAGLVHISQAELNSGAGYVNYMDYSNGEMRVGGPLVLGPGQACAPAGVGNPAGGATCPGARVQINDPAVGNTGTGRYSRAVSPDVRFMVDQDNPTITAGTGYPMCFPRSLTDPTAGGPDDPLCPQANRPVDGNGVPSINFTMNDPGAGIIVGSNPNFQAPIEVGDYISYSGTLTADNPLAPNPANTYISAHTIVNNAAIYTFPGTNPAYVSVEVSLLGTGGITLLGAQEAAIRTRFEGMTTDPSRSIRLYGVDVSPAGVITDRDWGTIDPDPGPIVGAVKGRWRFRPPCAPFGTIVAKPDKQCTNGPDNQFVPATREVRAVIDGVQTAQAGGAAAIPGWPEPAKGTPIVLTAANFPTSANGIFYGQYHAPIGEYIFPENVPGTPIVENNFNAMPFLANGGYTSATGVVAGVLNPWPSNVLPAPPCTAPIATAGGPYSVVNGGTITLAGSATGSTPTLAWTITPAQGTLSSTTIGNPVYTAPAFANGVTAVQTFVLSLTATNGCGTSTVPVTINVQPFSAPVVNAVPTVNLGLGAAGTINLTGSDPNTPAKTPLTYTVTQTGAPALLNLVTTQVAPTGAQVKFTTPATATTVTLTVTAKNSAGIVSAAVSITVKTSNAAVAPTAIAGGPYTVSSAGTIVLAGSASGSPTLTYAWTVPGGQGSFSGLTNSGTPTYRAPTVTVPTVVIATLRVTNSAGTGTSTATINVLPLVAPTVNPVAPITVFSGAQNGTFTVSAVDTNIPASTPINFTVTQTGAPALTNVSLGGGTTTSKVVTFRAPTLPVNQVAPSVITITIRATNAGGKVSNPITTTVSIVPLPDTVTLTVADYRTAKQRLILTATSSVIAPDLVLKLQPYLTVDGVLFDPSTLGDTFTNLGLGNYTLTLVGAPEPAIPPATPLTLRSNLNGVSAPHGLDLIRLN